MDTNDTTPPMPGEWENTPTKFDYWLYQILKAEQESKSSEELSNALIDINLKTNADDELSLEEKCAIILKIGRSFNDHPLNENPETEEQIVMQVAETVNGLKLEQRLDMFTNALNNLRNLLPRLAQQYRHPENLALEIRERIAKILRRSTEIKDGK